jgi:hypothetical protein
MAMHAWLLRRLALSRPGGPRSVVAVHAAPGNERGIDVTDGPSGRQQANTRTDDIAVSAAKVQQRSALPAGVLCRL